jgi:hypothetical protein
VLLAPTQRTAAAAVAAAAEPALSTHTQTMRTAGACVTMDTVSTATALHV